MSQVFSVLTLPRCRSAWLATFLDYPPAFVVHEPIRLRPNLKHLRELMEQGLLPWAGIVDPSLTAVASREWVEAFEGTPVGLVVRPAAEVEASLKASFPDTQDRMGEVVKMCMQGMETILDARGGEVPTIQAKDVGNLEALRTWLAKLVPELPFRESRFHQLERLQITVSGYTPEELGV